MRQSDVETGHAIPEDLAGSRDKLFMFLSGYLGGPPELRAWLMQQFFATADWMRNKEGDMPGQQ